jgi:hypothetical protein
MTVVVTVVSLYVPRVVVDVVLTVVGVVSVVTVVTVVV